MHVVYLAALLIGSWCLLSLLVGCVVGRMLRHAAMLPALSPASSPAAPAPGYDRWAA